MIQQNLALIGNGCWIILASLIIGTAHVVLPKLMVNLRLWKRHRCFPIFPPPNLLYVLAKYYFLDLPVHQAIDLHVFHTHSQGM